MISSVLVFLIVLSVLVLVHELGHYIAAKKAGIWVEEFGFGIPPRIWGKKIGQTIYSLNLLPFGGFVRLHGETREEDISKPGKAFLSKSKKTRAIVIVAGVLMNFVLAIVAFAIVYSFSGIPKETQNVKVLETMANSPAADVQILPGDIVRQVDDIQISSTDKFINAIEEKKGKKVELTIARDGTEQKISVVPREDPPEQEGPLGVLISSTEVYFPPLWQRPFVGIYYGFKDAFFWGKTVIFGFISLFSDLISGEIPTGVSGPIGIFALTSEVAKIGILSVINFIGILSVNLAILNIAPFPALDGGRLLFIVLESVLGRKILPKAESVIHAIGMAILILLLLAITAYDIKRLITFGGISGFIESFLK
jgi:regulator of sigma E protease